MAASRSRSARASRRRRRRLSQAVHDLTDEQWAALKVAWDGCAYCGVRDVALERDCLLPISRGGRYTLENVVPACRACNASKCNAETTTWLRHKGLDERAFLTRYVALRSALAAPGEVPEAAG
jgi:5-methylcytosine-specific restriction endonuclease McrA